MRPLAPGEWSATLGWVAWRSYLLVYVFSLVPALLIGAAPLPRAAFVAVLTWTCGALIVAVGATYCVTRFRLQAIALLLPGRRAVLGRTVVWLTGVIVVLPAVAFWLLVPGSWPWTPLIMAVPVAAALTTSLCIRAAAERAGNLEIPGTRQAHPSARQAICMFLGRPFTPLPSGLRTRGVVALGLLLWVTPPVLCRVLSMRAWHFLMMPYAVLTMATIWMWFVVTLASFRSHHVANYAELALLPGLGNSAQRRRALYGAVLARPLLLAFSAIATWVLSIGWQSHSPARIERSVLCGIVLLLFCCGVLFQQLMADGNGRTRVGVAQAINAAVMPLVVALALHPTDGWIWRLPAQWLYYILLTTLAAVPLTVIGFCTSGLTRQAHPFLAPAD